MHSILALLCTMFRFSCPLDAPLQTQDSVQIQLMLRAQASASAAAAKLDAAVSLLEASAQTDPYFVTIANLLGSNAFADGFVSSIDPEAIDAESALILVASTTAAFADVQRVLFNLDAAHDRKLELREALEAYEEALGYLAEAQRNWLLQLIARANRMTVVKTESFLIPLIRKPNSNAVQLWQPGSYHLEVICAVEARFVHATATDIASGETVMLVHAIGPYASIQKELSETRAVNIQVTSDNREPRICRLNVSHRRLLNRESTYLSDGVQAEVIKQADAVARLREQFFAEASRVRASLGAASFRVNVVTDSAIVIFSAIGEIEAQARLAVLDDDAKRRLDLLALLVEKRSERVTQAMLRMSGGMATLSSLLNQATQIATGITQALK